MSQIEISTRNVGQAYATVGMITLGGRTIWTTRNLPYGMDAQAMDAATEDARCIALIAAELREVVAETTMERYLSDDTGSDSLDFYRSIVEIRTGLGRRVATYWDAAMDMLRAE